jgi:hypothetical protein
MLFNTERNVAESFEQSGELGEFRGERADLPVPRLVTDAEGVLSADNGALRIAPLIESGWGRVGLAYGPFEREAGLALAVYMLNGHNTAQAENLPESLWQRLDRWCLGSNATGRWQRLRSWWASGRVRRTARLFRWWLRLRRGRNVRRLDDNLAVGWFADPAPLDPTRNGNAFVMRATGAHNGELRTNVSARSLPVLHGVPNLPLYYVAVLRETGATYFAASTPATGDLPDAGALRPLAIDAHAADRQVYAALTQSTMGQIGFRIDTRVYGVRVHKIPAWSNWYASAHAADQLTGSGGIDAQPADTGGRWLVLNGAFQRGDAGVTSLESGLAVLRPSAASGLLHARVRLRDERARIGLVWSCTDAASFVCFEVGAAQCRVVRLVDGEAHVLGQADFQATLGDSHAIQVLCGEKELRCSVDGQLVLSVPAIASGIVATGVGIRSEAAAGSTIERFEAHPRTVPLPPALYSGTVSLPEPAGVVVRETFAGTRRELTDMAAGNVARWQRLFGNGMIDVTGEGHARVRATERAPNPGRTAFAIDWPDEKFADLGLQFTVPGSDRHQRHKARLGFVAWQDEDNYLLIGTWNSDVYDGGSVSSFFHIDGFEDLYDAVWTNVGRRLWWGRKVHLRLRFDGQQFLVELDGEPVLYRKLTDVYSHCAPLRIRKVGILVNWEWGDDTGSLLHEFVARAGQGALSR